MQLRLCIIGHCDRGGHRAFDSTYSSIKEHFFWKTMYKDISSFCGSCLHCISTSAGQRVPRPFGHALHSDKPKEIIHFDFIYMGDSVTGDRYALIIKDDASIYTWLNPAKQPEADVAARLLLNWFAAFGVAPVWVSDRGSHFKYKLMDMVNPAPHAHHHFTTPNNPQANGTVERVCREVLRTCRVLSSEFRMKDTEWPHILPLIQVVLNHSKVASLGNRAPITAFTGSPADNPPVIIPPQTAKPKISDDIKVLQRMNTEKLLQSLAVIHKDVAEGSNRRRENAFKDHNDKTKVQAANFSVGDYVLVAKRIAKDGRKLRLRWLGPQRIIRVVSDWSYEIQDLLNERVSLVHANRLKFYADSQLNVTQELLDTIDHNDVHYNVALKLLNLRYNFKQKEYELEVKWKGFSHEEPTWESLQNIHEDIPVMSEKFLKSYSAKAQRARNSLRTFREGGM